MGNETQNIKKDLIDLDIEEMKINRELYNLQLQINAKLPNDKKVKIKSNYKQIAERKIHYLEQKKLKLLASEKEKSKEIIKIDNIAETGENEVEKNNIEDNKLSLISNSSKGSKKAQKGMLIDKIEEKINENNSNNKEIISDTENGKIKTIYTKKKSKNINKININELNDKNNDNINDNINDNNEKVKNNNEDSKNNDINDNNLEENLNINEYKRKFFDKLSSLGPISNANKSMDNKNSSVLEELEVVGLSQNDILKDKLSEFFVGTSVASSSNNNRNNSSMHNNYYKNRPKSEISGINQQLISASKSGNENNESNGENEDNEDKEDNNTYNSQNNKNSNYEENQEYIDRNNENENENGYGTGITGEKYDTEETMNKEVGNNNNEKYKEKNNINEINERKLLKNNRNKSYFVLEDSSGIDNSSAKESKNME